MARLRTFFWKHKTLVISLGFLVLFSSAVAYASPPGSSYTPGQTLDPQCAPGSANCSVSFNYEEPLTFSSGLTQSGSTITSSLSTGISGGQTIIGGTGTADALSFIGTAGNGSLSSPALNFDVGNDGATNALTVLNNGGVGVGVTNPAGTLVAGGNRSASAWGVNGIDFQTKGATYTDTSSSGTVSDLAINSIGASSIIASHPTVYTEASTLYIAGAPGTNTNTTITNPWALNVATGDTNLGGVETVIGNAVQKVTIGSSNNGGIISFNRDPNTGFINDSGGYGFTLQHSDSSLAASDKLALTLFNPSGAQLSQPLVINGQGYVGINGAVLNQAFNVYGNIEISGSGNGIYFPDGSFMSTNAGGAGVGTTSTTDLDFSADSDDNGTGVINFTVHGIGAMTMANNGEVGIATTNPTQALTVNGNIQVAGTGNGIYFPDGSFMGSAANLGTGITAPGNVAMLADSNNTDSTAGITLATAGTTYFNMINNGNIGIGNDVTPSTTLQIVPTTNNGVMIGAGAYPSWMGSNGLYVNGTFHAGTNVINSGSGVNWGASEARIIGVNPGTDTNSYLSFYTGSMATQGERMRIIDNGDIGIGTITPDALLSIGTVAVPTATVVADFTNDGGECTLDPSTIGGLSCSSDMRLKKNITNLSDGSAWSFDSNITPASQNVLDKVLALNPVDYNWDVEADGTPQHAGFIAQEVQQVFPDLVQTNPTTGYLTLDYTGLVPYTVEAIKEMNLNISNIDNLGNSDGWRDAIENWFADNANGIKNFFSGTVTTNQLCVKDDSGETCLTRSQIDQILGNDDTNTAGGTTVINTDTDNGTDTTSVISDSSSTTSDGDTQSVQVSAPTPDDSVSDDGSTQSPQ
jgi:hypothetical protein